MPINLKRKRSSSLSSYSKSRAGRSTAKPTKKRARRATLVVQPNVLADRTKVRLRYSTYTDLLSLVGAATSDAFYGNGLYDPYVAAGGEQPMGFDQWNNFYNKHVVIGSGIRVQCMNMGLTAPTQTAIVSLTPCITGSLPTVDNRLETLRETQYSKWTAVNIATPKNLYHYMSTAKMFGKSADAIQSEDNYSGTAGSNPATTWQWLIGMDAVDGTSTTAMYFTIDIWYDVIFYDRKNLPPS